MRRSAEAGKSGDPLPNNSSGGKATADAVDPGVEQRRNGREQSCGSSVACCDML